MKLVKNLADVSEEEQSKFIKSFDHVLSDMDGVLWIANETFPYSAECVDLLKQRGKKVGFVTNNPLVNEVELYKKLVREGFNAEISDVANPLLSVISYLKIINFNKTIFVMGSHAFKEELRKQNFKVAPDPPQVIEETVQAFLKQIEDDEEIGAVIFSWDLNLTFLKVQKAITYLKRKDCLFLITADDKTVPVGPLGPLYGNKLIIDMVKEFTGKEPIRIGKPSAYYAEFVNKRFGVIDPRRAVFIGDQIYPDMAFATRGGYQKLLVLTGITKIEHVNNWQHPEEDKPEYYIESLDVLRNILKTVK